MTAVLYHVTFDDFCDWYAEAIKPRLYGGDEAAAATALAALERLLALLHPVMPHVTEEIWTQLPSREARLIVSSWPESDERHAADAGALDRVQEAAHIFRRSGVQVELGSADERRIFAAVVRPERTRAGWERGRRDRAAPKRGGARRGDARRTSGSWRTRPRRWSKPSGRSSSATAASSTHSNARAAHSFVRFRT